MKTFMRDNEVLTIERLINTLKHAQVKFQKTQKACAETFTAFAENGVFSLTFIHNSQKTCVVKLEKANDEMYLQVLVGEQSERLKNALLETTVEPDEQSKIKTDLDNFIKISKS